ncbi:F-box domain-containing protein [Pleurotus pulmonarius]
MSVIESDAELAAYLSYGEPPSDNLLSVGDEYPAPNIINTLPLELISKIFHTFCIQHPPTRVLRIAAVCRLWRDVSFATPELWDRLHIRALPDGSLVPSLNIIKLSLVRSGMRLLDITMDYRYGSLTDQEQSGRPSSSQNLALPVLLEHANRWRKIDFTIADLDPKTWDAIGNASPSLLEDVEIKARVTLQQSQLNALSRMLLSCTRLTRWVWSHPLHARLGVQVPWHQLTTLWLHCPILFPLLLDILGQSTSLTTCLVVAVFKDGFIDGSTLPVVRLPFLTSLDIRVFTDSRAVPQLFDPLTFPSLTKLTITIPVGSTTIPAWPRTQYLSFIARSRASLATLILEKVNISEDDVITCLEQSQQTLTRLSISGRVVRNVGDKLLQRLTLEPPTPSGAVDGNVGVGEGLCPHLESIQFMDGCLWSSDGLLGEMVRSRFHPDNIFRHGLWQLSVDFTISVDQEHALDKEILVQLADEGLSMRFDDIPGQRLAIGWVE